MTFPLFFPAVLILLSADLERGEEPGGARVLRLFQIRLVTLSLAKI